MRNADNFLFGPSVSPMAYVHGGAFREKAFFLAASANRPQREHATNHKSLHTEEKFVCSDPD